MKAIDIINLIESINPYLYDVINIHEYKKILYTPLNISECLYFINEQIKVLEIFKITDHGVYEVREELWESPCVDDTPVKITAAYSKEDGTYLGDPKTAKTLVEKFGVVKFMKSKPDHTVASIGFCENVPTGIYKGKTGWAGWSHRAICIFGIGDKLFNEEEHSKASEDTPFVESGSVIITNMEQAKIAAINFAHYVS